MLPSRCERAGIPSANSVVKGAARICGHLNKEPAQFEIAATCLAVEAGHLGGFYSTNVRRAARNEKTRRYTYVFVRFGTAGHLETCSSRMKHVTQIGTQEDGGRVELCPAPLVASRRAEIQTTHLHEPGRGDQARWSRRPSFSAQ